MRLAFASLLIVVTTHTPLLGQSLRPWIYDGASNGVCNIAFSRTGLVNLLKGIDLSRGIPKIGWNQGSYAAMISTKGDRPTAMKALVRIGVAYLGFDKAGATDQTPKTFVIEVTKRDLERLHLQELKLTGSICIYSEEAQFSRRRAGDSSGAEK